MGTVLDVDRYSRCKKSPKMQTSRSVMVAQSRLLLPPTSSFVYIHVTVRRCIHRNRHQTRSRLNGWLWDT